MNQFPRKNHHHEEGYCWRGVKGGFTKATYKDTLSIDLKE